MTAERKIRRVTIDLPNELYDTLKTTVQEQDTSIQRFTTQAIENALREPDLVKRLICFFENDARNIEVYRRNEFLSISWETNDDKKRLICDTRTGEIVHNLNLADDEVRKLSPS